MRSSRGDTSGASPFPGAARRRAEHLLDHPHAAIAPQTALAVRIVSCRARCASTVAVSTHTPASRTISGRASAPRQSSSEKLAKHDVTHGRPEVRHVEEERVLPIQLAVSGEVPVGARRQELALPCWNVAQLPVWSMTSSSHRLSGGTNSDDVDSRRPDVGHGLAKERPPAHRTADIPSSWRPSWSAEPSGTRRQPDPALAAPDRRASPESPPPATAPGPRADPSCAPARPSWSTRPAVVQRPHAEEGLPDPQRHHLPLVAFEAHACFGLPEAREPLVERIEVHAPDHALQAGFAVASRRIAAISASEAPLMLALKTPSSRALLDVHPHHDARAAHEEGRRSLGADAIGGA